MGVVPTSIYPATCPNSPLITYYEHLCIPIQFHTTPSGVPTHLLLGEIPKGPRMGKHRSNRNPIQTELRDLELRGLGMKV